MNRILHHAAAALLLALAIVAAVGATRTGLFAQPAWNPTLGGHLRALLLFGALVAGAVALARRRGWPPGLAGFAAATVAALWFAGIGAVATVAVVLLSAFCLGRRCVPATAFAAPGAVALAFALGLAGLSFAVGVLSFFPVASAGLYLALMAAPIAWGFADSRALLQQAWAAWLAPAPARSIAETALVVALGVGLALQGLAVLQPELGYDSLHVHLTVVDQLRTLGRAEYDVRHFAWAVMPMGADWTFALAALPGGESAARLLNFAGELALLSLLHAYVAPRAGRLAALAAVALYALTPLVYLETVTLFVDTLWCLWLVSALACAARSLDEDDPRWVVAAAAAFGTALATKVIAVYALPFLVATAVAWIVRRRRAWPRDLALAAAVVAVFGALPYANAWLRTGNPVFPFFNHWFHSPLYGAEAFDNVLYHQHPGWRLLYDMTFRSNGYLESSPGAIGLLWLVLLPPAALLAWRSGTRHAVAFVLALAFVAGVFASQTYLRYVLPMFAVLAVLSTLALAPLARERVPRALLAALLSAGFAAGLVLYFVASWDYRSLRVPPGPDPQARREFARGRTDERLAPAVLDALELRHVLWLGPPRFAGSAATIETLDWVSPANAARFRALQTSSDARAWIAERDFDAIVIAPGFDACAQPGFCAFLARDTTVVYEPGSLVVRAVNADVLFDRELLANPGFDGGTASWTGEGVVDPATGHARVDETRVLFQAVPAVAGAKYRLEADAACVPGAPPAALRLQVGWTDRHGHTLATTLRPVDCAGAPHGGMTLVAPARTASAVVSVSAHVAGRPVEVDRVSLRQ